LLAGLALVRPVLHHLVLDLVLLPVRANWG
jgi:hypothetical protein